MKNVAMIKLFGRHAVLFTLLGAPVAVGASQGCGLSTELCDAYCECVRCNDRQEADCKITVQESLDVGDAYDCTEEMDAYWQCALDKHDCDDNNFVTDEDCNDERDDLVECIDDNSDLLNLQMAGPGQGPGPQQGGGQTFCQCACTCTMCTIADAQRTCGMGEGGCESCDIVCTDACLADDTCGALDTSAGACVPVP